MKYGERLTVLFFFVLTFCLSAKELLYVRPSGWTTNPQPIIGGRLSDAGKIEVRVVSSEGKELVSWQIVAKSSRAFIFRPTLELPTGIYIYEVRQSDKVLKKKVYIDRTPPNISELSATGSDKEVKIDCLASDKGSGLSQFILRGTWDSEKSVMQKKEVCSFALPPEGQKLEYSIEVADKVGLGKKTSIQSYEKKAGEKQKKSKADTKKEKKKRKKYGPTQPGKKLPFFENCNQSIYATMQGRFGQAKTTQGFAGNDFEQTILTQVNCKLDKIHVDASVDAIPRQPNRFLVEIGGKHESGRIGNFVALGAKGSKFLAFQKQGKGMEVKTKHRPIEARVFFTESQSFTRTATFLGNSTKGPYKIGFNILPQSETIIEEDKITGENRTLTRDTDYLIDPFEGTVTFTEIKTSDQKFTVSFEIAILDLALRTGDIEGFQTKFKIGKHQKWNVIALQEKVARGGGVNTVATTEDFFSFIKEGSDETDLQREYPLTMWPLLEKSELVEVQEGAQLVIKEPQVQNEGDYRIDFSRGTIIFTKRLDGSTKLPGTDGDAQTIKVSYTAKSAIGKEYTIPLNKCTELTPSSFECSLIDLDLNGDGFPDQITISDESFVRVWKKTKGATGNIFVKENFLSPDTGDPDNDPPVTHYSFTTDAGSITKLVIKSAAGVTNADSVILQERELRQSKSSTTGKGDVPKRAFSFGQKWSFGRHLKLEWELALSSAQKEKLGKKISSEITNITEVNASDSTALATLDRGGCTVCPVVPGSDQLTLKKSDGTTIPLRRSRFGQSGDYLIDYNTGRLFLNSSLGAQVGDEIEASYSIFEDKANPFTGDTEKVSGNALTSALSFAYPKWTLRGSYRKVDPTFIPVGASRPVPEKGESNINLTLKPLSFIDLSSSYSQKKRPDFDFARLEETGKVTESKAFTGGMKLTYKSFPEIQLSHQQQETNIKPTNTRSKTTTEKLLVKKAFGSVLTLFNWNQASTKALANPAGNRKNTTLDFKTSLASRKKYDLKVGVQLKSVKNPNNSKLDSQIIAYRFDGKYKLSRKFQMDTQLLFQDVAKDASHPNGFTTNNFKFGFLQETLDIPLFFTRPLRWKNIRVRAEIDQNKGETPARTTVRSFFSTSFDLKRPWDFSPSYSFLLSRRGSINQTRTHSITLNLGYKTLGKRQLSFKLSQTMAFTRQKTKPTTGVATSQNTKSFTTNLRNRFVFPRNLEWNNSISFQTTNSSSTGNTSRLSPKLQLKYRIGRKSSVMLRVQHEIQKQKGKKTSRTDSLLNWSQRISEFATLSFNYNFIRTETNKNNVGTVKLELRF